MLAGILLAAEKVLRSKTRKVQPARARRVLILEYRFPLGCLVHMTPAFEAMKRSRPEIEIAVATRGLGSQVLRHSRFVDHLIDAPDPTAHLGAAVRGLRKELRTRSIQPDCVLTGASDQRTRIALMALVGADGWRGGYTLKPALYQRPLVYDQGLSLIRNNLRLAKLIGCQADVTQPRVFFSEQDAATAKALLREANPDGRPLIVMVTQNSGGQSTGWHMNRFVQVIDDATRVQGCAVVYVGTSGDVAAIEAIRQAAGGVGTSLAGKTTVSELAAVLASSDYMVTLDTGTMHVGRAAGVPMVVLGPSWQKPLEWMPLGVENVRILRGPNRAEMPQDYRFDEISAESVTAALGDLINLYPAAAAARELRLQDGLSEIDHLAAG
jgi:ADP-heptose:LPS heptosyltransferase